MSNNISQQVEIVFVLQLWASLFALDTNIFFIKLELFVTNCNGPASAYKGTFRIEPLVSFDVMVIEYIDNTCENM